MEPQSIIMNKNHMIKRKHIIDPQDPFRYVLQELNILYDEYKVDPSKSLYDNIKDHRKREAKKRRLREILRLRCDHIAETGEDLL